jgi:hypothetical protein
VSLNKINDHRTVQAEILTACVHQRLGHVRQRASHFPHGRPKALSGELAIRVGPQLPRHLPTGMQPRVQRQIGDQLAGAAVRYVDLPPVDLHRQRSQHPNPKHTHTVSERGTPGLGANDGLTQS